MSILTVGVGDIIKFKNSSEKDKFANKYCANAEFAQWSIDRQTNIFKISSVCKRDGITGIYGYTSDEISIISLYEFGLHFEIVKKAASKPNAFEFAVEKSITLNDVKVTQETYKDFIESVRKVFE
ncbi:hypothetical protein fHeYen901_13 [Yersinia phage fHe-Yen9-01]|uniref:Uncharacterized protein n=1 Tax=Yersinia phage fHe-Yen9-01 TaxID=1965363 RepID=A0A1V0DXB5_9CAUD|nr:hypothetical protein KNT60_gp012 [Yersinia phage fHe-Yen9-01]ARB05786.1 hypothetical protein fHeYen901_13 [Yersinia phage fHe-Yen9-01]